MINETQILLNEIDSYEGLFALQNILNQIPNQDNSVKTTMYEKMWSLLGDIAADGDKLHFSSIEPLINDKFPDLKSFFSIKILKDLFDKNAPQQHRTNTDALQYIIDNLSFSSPDVRKDALLLCFDTPSNRSKETDLPFQVFRDIFYHSPQSEIEQLFLTERLQTHLKEHKYYSFLQDQQVLNEHDVQCILNANLQNNSSSFKDIIRDLNQYNIYGEMISKNILNTVIQQITTRPKSGAFSNKLTKKDIFDKLSTVNNWKKARDENGASLYHHLSVYYASYFNTFSESELNEVLNLTDNQGLKPVDYFVLNGFKNSKDVNEFVIDKMIESGLHSTTKISISSVAREYRDLVFKSDKGEKTNNKQMINRFIDAFSVSWLDTSDLCNHFFTRNELSNHIRGFVRSLSREHFQQLDTHSATILVLLNSYGDELKQYYGKPGILFDKIKGLGLCVTPDIEEYMQQKNYTFKIEFKYLEQYMEILKEDYSEYEKNKLHEKLDKTTSQKNMINRI